MLFLWKKKTPIKPHFLFPGAREVQEFCRCPQRAEGMLWGGHIPQVPRDGLGAGCWRHSWFLMLLEVWEATFLTKILLAANQVLEVCQWGGKGLCSCSWPSLGSAGSSKGTTRTRRDPRKILALLELTGVLHLTSARSRVLPKEY